MTIRLYWRCEAAALVSGTDHSTGDTNWGSTGTPTFVPTAARIGTNGMLIDAGTEYVALTQDAITPDLGRKKGSFAFWWQCPVAFATTAEDLFLLDGNVGKIAARSSTTVGKISFRITDGLGATPSITSNTTLSVANWYFLVFRWESLKPRMALEIYNTSMVQIDRVEDVTTSISGPTTLQGNIRIGHTAGAETNTMYYDNVFISDDPDEPLQTYALINTIVGVSVGLRFFWRCEATPLTSGDVGGIFDNVDFTTGDTSAASTGQVSFDSLAARCGTKGIYVNTPIAASQYRFDPTGIFFGLDGRGCMGMSIQFPTAFPAAHIAWITCRDTASNEEVNIRVGPDGAALLRFNAGGVNQDITTSAGALTLGKWYGLVGRWNHALNRREIWVYDQHNALVTRTISGAAYTKPSTTMYTELVTGFRIGVGQADVSAYIDNVLVSDDPDEPLQYNLTINNFDVDYDKAKRGRILMGRSLAT